MKKIAKAGLSLGFSLVTAAVVSFVLGAYVKWIVVTFVLGFDLVGSIFR